VQVFGGQLVATEKLAAQHVDGLPVEEAGLDVGAEFWAAIVLAVLVVLAAEPGTSLDGINLGEEVTAKREIDVAREEKAICDDGMTLGCRANERRIPSCKEAREEVVDADFGVAPVGALESPCARCLALGVGHASLSDGLGNGPMAGWGRRQRAWGTGTKEVSGSGMAALGWRVIEVDHMCIVGHGSLGLMANCWRTWRRQGRRCVVLKTGPLAAGLGCDVAWGAQRSGSVIGGSIAGSHLLVPGADWQFRGLLVGRANEVGRPEVGAIIRWEVRLVGAPVMVAIANGPSSGGRWTCDH
jgi:hypothetical protein